MVSQKILSKLLFLQNGICPICKKSLVGTNFHIHHLDKNRKNNSLENLLLLHRKCHMLIHAKKSLIIPRKQNLTIAKKLIRKKPVSPMPMNPIKGVSSEEKLRYIHELMDSIDEQIHDCRVIFLEGRLKE